MPFLLPLYTVYLGVIARDIANIHRQTIPLPLPAASMAGVGICSLVVVTLVLLQVVLPYTE